MSSYRPTILIFGISSFVGSNLAEFFRKEYRVIGTYNLNPVHIPGVLTVPCDVLKKESVQLVLYSLQPDITIYLVGLSSIYDCSEAPALADALNTNGLINVSEYTARYKSKLICITSGYVFSGDIKDRSYMEMDIPDANTEYGKNVAASEFYVQKTSLDYLIFRCCVLYGRSLNPIQLSWFEGLQKKFKKGDMIMCDNYIHTGFLDVMYLGMVVQLCLQKGVANRLYQVSSNDFGTRYDFARTYARIFFENENMLIKGRWKFPYVQSHTLSQAEDELSFRLDTSNIEGYLDIKLPTIEEALKFTHRRLYGPERAEKKMKRGDDVTYI